MPELSALGVAVHLLIATPVPADVDLVMMAAELRRIWQPALTLTVDAPGTVPDGGRTIWLRFADTLGPDAHARALGWTPFTEGRPGAVITISPSRIRVVVAHGPSRPCGRRTGSGCVTRLSRAVARVAAHEVGHVLLGAAGHDRSGLMRAGLDRNELLDPEPAGLTLPAGIRNLLRDRKALEARAGRTGQGPSSQ